MIHQLSDAVRPLQRPLMTACLALLGVAFFVTPMLAQETAATKPAIEKQDQDTEKEKAELKALHDKLAKYLSGTKWTGNFTMGDGKTITEYYEILSAEKAELGDKWNLVARIKYGGKDRTLPLPPIDIKFAGKTPVITVDRVLFPGFGTFDARVVIRRGKYAGTWQHDAVGGHLFGTIERMSDEELDAGQKKVEKTDPKKEEQSDGGNQR